MSGSPFIPPSQTPVNSTGRPYAGSSWTFYAAGTSTLAVVYSDSALTTPLANPVYADAAGLFPAIYLDPDAGYNYRALLRNSTGTLLRTHDDIPAGVASSGGGDGTSGTPGLSVAEVKIYIRSTATPATPTGGSFSFATQTLTAPAGWTQAIPAGSEPVWASSAVASVSGATGTDSTLAWSAPVRVYSDGSSVDIIFRRNSGQPATPAPSANVPTNWYSDVDSVPTSTDTLWSSVGTRANSSELWVWQLPIQVEGETGPAGPSALQYYIKPLSGTAIKNSSGTLTVEAHKLEGGTDTLLSTGTIQLYVGSTLVNEANGYASGSNGFTGVFDSGDISGSVVVTLKDGAAGEVLDSITLVDVVDGTVGGVGTDAVYGYIEADGELAWVRSTDQTTWTPTSLTRDFDCNFVQSGADVARVAYRITRDADGFLTGASTTHKDTDLNSSRVTVTAVGSGTRVMTVKFFYSFSGDETLVAETVYTSLSGATGTTGSQGETGPGALTIRLTRPIVPLMSYQNGGVVSFANANGHATVWSGQTDVTATATFNAAVATGCTGTINTGLDTPISGLKGYYAFTAMSADTATFVISATYNGATTTVTVALNKAYVGFEIVASLPVTNLFEGRIVFLTTDDKLYRYTGSAWTRAVDGADLTANSVTANAIAAGTITAAKIAAGTITSASGVIGNLAIENASIANLTLDGTKMTAKAVSDSFLYTWSSTDVTNGTAIVAANPSQRWLDVTQTGIDARVTVTGIPTTGGARVVISVNMNVGAVSGGSNNRWRIVRVEDNAVIAPAEIRSYLRETSGQVVSWNFIDSAPISASHIYKLQIYRNGSAAAGVWFDITLLATLYKK